MIAVNNFGERFLKKKKKGEERNFYVWKRQVAIFFRDEK